MSLLKNVFYTLLPHYFSPLLPEKTHYEKRKILNISNFPSLDFIIKYYIFRRDRRIDNNKIRIISTILKFIFKEKNIFILYLRFLHITVSPWGWK